MQQQTNQLSDFEEQAGYLPASKGIRLANMIIDSVVCSLVTYAVLYLLFPEPGISGFEEQLDNNMLTEWGVSYFVYFIYYIVAEFALKGRTVGKLVTSTKAVTVNGEPFTLRHAALRSLVRLIPIEAFSYLGKNPSGWHDTWTKTRVVSLQK